MRRVRRSWGSSETGARRCVCAVVVGNNTHRQSRRALGSVSSTPNHTVGLSPYIGALRSYTAEQLTLCAHRHVAPSASWATAAARERATPVVVGARPRWFLTYNAAWVMCMTRSQNKGRHTTWFTATGWKFVACFILAGFLTSTQVHSSALSALNGLVFTCARRGPFSGHMQMTLYATLLLFPVACFATSTHARASSCPRLSSEAT
jgi:hypothetical protein